MRAYVAYPYALARAGTRLLATTAHKFRQYILCQYFPGIMFRFLGAAASQNTAQRATENRLKQPGQFIRWENINRYSRALWECVCVCLCVPNFMVHSYIRAAYHKVNMKFTRM